MSLLFIPGRVPVHVFWSAQQSDLGGVEEAGTSTGAGHSILTWGPRGLLGQQQCRASHLEPVWQPECAAGQPGSLSNGTCCCHIRCTAFFSVVFLTLGPPCSEHLHMCCIQFMAPLTALRCCKCHGYAH